MRNLSRGALHSVGLHKGAKAEGVAKELGLAVFVVLDFVVNLVGRLHYKGTLSCQLLLIHV